MIRHLLLDWSGTLADDLHPVLAATNAIFEHYGRPPLSLETFREKFRLPFSGFYAELLPEATEEGLDRLYERFFRHLNDEVQLLPGARELLEFCRRAGIHTALLSTIKPSHFELQARRLGVNNLFDAVYTGVRDKRERIREILATHHWRAEETAFVGDMVHDIETARHGGVLSIAVLTGFDPGSKLLSARPDILCQGLPVLLRLLHPAPPASSPLPCE